MLINKAAGRISSRIQRIGMIALPFILIGAAIYGDRLGRSQQDLSCNEIGSISIANQSRWPGGGANIIVRLLGIDGLPLTEDQSGCLQWIWGVEGIETQVVADRRQMDPGFTVVVLRPSTSQDDSSSLSAAVASLLVSRPADERMALWSWGSSLVTISDFTTDRDWLIRQANRYYHTGNLDTTVIPVATGEVVNELRNLMATVGGEARWGMRSVVIFGRDIPDIPLELPSSESALFQWVVGGLTSEEIAVLGEGTVVLLNESTLLTNSMLKASSRMETIAREGFYSLGACGNWDSMRVTITAGERAAPVSIDLQPSPRDERTLACEPSVVASAQRIYSERIGFELTTSQRNVYNDYVASGNRNDFSLSVRVWPEGDLASATAHLRGRASMGCERKSYALRFDDPGPRHLVSSGANREWYLIALCLDHGYVSSLFGYTVMSKLRIFSPAFRLVELHVDGETQGFYLLIDKVTESLERDYGSLRSVIRRSLDMRGDLPEIKVGRSSEEEALDEYNDLLTDAEGPTGEALVRLLEDRLDLDAYLRWLAFNIAVQSGDYVDELWLFATDSLAEDGTTVGRFGLIGWDPDDLLAPCHYLGEFEITDSWGLLYCTESVLDHIILSDTVVYKRYVDILGEILNGVLSADSVSDTLEIVADQVMPWFKSPTITAAMVELVANEPRAIDPAVAMLQVGLAIDRLELLLAERRELLQNRIAVYRSANP